MTAPGFGRGLSLQVKLVALLLVVVLIPPAASAYLITRVSRVAADFAAVEAASRNQSLERALRTYRELIETKKQHLAEVARRLAQDPRIAGLDGEALETVLASEPEVSRLALFDRVGRELAKAERPPPEGSEIKSVKFPLLAGGSLEVGVPVPAGLQQELRELSDSLTAARMVAGNRSALSAGYVLAFLAIVGGSALAAILVGVSRGPAGHRTDRRAGRGRAGGGARQPRRPGPAGRHRRGLGARGGLRRHARRPQPAAHRDRLPAAHRRLAGRRAAPGPRDQEPADPDPARGPAVRVVVRGRRSAVQAPVDRHRRDRRGGDRRPAPAGRHLPHPGPAPAGRGRAGAAVRDRRRAPRSIRRWPSG
jgi:hypothetical protein